MKFTSTLYVLILGLLAGCSANFPYGRSMDRHNFVSDAHMPKTILLIDSVTKQEVTRWDVPVGKTLVVDLEHEADWTAGMHVADPAYKVTWAIIDNKSKWYLPTNEQSLALNGNPVYLRMYDTRQAPPRPQDSIPSAPAVQPTTTPVKPDQDRPLPPQPPTEQPKSQDQPEYKPVPRYHPKPYMPDDEALKPQTGIQSPAQTAPGEPKYPLDEILEKQNRPQGSTLDSTRPAEPPAPQPEPPAEKPTDEPDIGGDLEPDLPM